MKCQFDFQEMILQKDENGEYYFECPICNSRKECDLPRV